MSKGNNAIGPADRAAFLERIARAEIERQQSTISLIPSENYVSERVLRAIASPLTNKYAEGEPHRRYYQGNKNVDELEVFLDALILQAFKLDPAEWHVNAKAVSAAVANFSILNTVLRPGDRILSMYLYDGGHLSHGWDMADGRGVTIASRIFQVERYHVNPETETIDYAELEQLARRVQPKLIITGGTAYPREINYKKTADIAKSIGAYYLADIAHEAGLVVGGAADTPFPHADFVSMSTQKTLRGPRGSIVVCRQEYGRDLDRAIFPGLQGGPFVHHLYAMAVAMDEALSPQFVEYASRVVANAKTLAQDFKSAGVRLVAGGTDKHLLVLDLRSRSFTGKDAAVALEGAGLVANYNTVPYDRRSPLNPSGLRLGTPAATTRGLGCAEMSELAQCIIQVLEDPMDQSVQKRVLESTKALCRKYPLWY